MSRKKREVMVAELEPKPKAMGKCFCGKQLEDHPECESCGILTGSGHEHYLSRYREHSLCGKCMGDWKRMEVLAQREVTFEELVKGFSLKEMLTPIQEMKQERNRQVIKKLNNGEAIFDIAKEFNLSVRTIERIQKFF